MKALCAVLVALTMTGCASRVRLEAVKTAVPVACAVDMPVRPTMPTEQMEVRDPRMWLDTFVASAVAEIELREGYEGKLVAALAKCRAPFSNP